MEVTSRGDMELSLTGEFAWGGVVGPEEFVGMESEGWLNKHLATLDPLTNDPFGTELLDDDSGAQEG